MPRLLLIAILVAVGIAGPQWAYADIRYHSVVSRGTGRDYGEALNDSIVGAVAQVCGKKIAAETGMRTARSMLDGKFSESRAIQQNLQSSTRGILKSYRVIASGTDSSSGRSFVEIDAQVPVYVPPEQTHRRKIVLLAPTLDDDVRLQESEPFARKLAGSLEAALTQTRRFAIIDRELSADRKQELEKYAERPDSLENSLRSGQTLVADNVVAIRILRYDRSSSLNGESALGPRLSATVSVRIVDVETGQVKFAQEYSTRAHLTSRREPTDVATTLGNRFAASIVEAIYPALVVDVTGEMATLNIGGPGIKAGRRFVVNAAGSTLTDPYSGESLGSAELPVAEVEVVTATDRIATVRIVSGELPAGAPAGALIARSKPASPTQALEEFWSEVEKTRLITTPKPSKADDDGW